VTAEEFLWPPGFHQALRFEGNDPIRLARRAEPGQIPRQVNPEILRRARQTPYRMRSAAERSSGVATRGPNL
jgi:hypothetical protein